MVMSEDGKKVAVAELDRQGGSTPSTLSPAMPQLKDMLISLDPQPASVSSFLSQLQPTSLA